jgi:hypothetical protein
VRSKWSKKRSPGRNAVHSGLAFAWQEAQRSLRCSFVSLFTETIFQSFGASPGGRPSKALTCSPAGPWQVSQETPGSAQTVRYESVAGS